MDLSIESSSYAVPAHRLCAKPQLSSSLPGLDSNDSPSWTAARCHRLLRQLQSRLASLRKLVSEDRLNSSTKPKRPANDEPRTTSKRIRLTYGQKTTQPAPLRHDPTTPPRSIRTLGTMRLGNSSPASGTVDFHTPVWRKIREQTDTPRHTSNFASTPFEEEDFPTTTLSNMTDEMRLLRQMVPDGHYRIFEAIFDWLNVLLRSTTLQPEQVHPKSLLAMCLRRVPACIADIEAWERRRSKEDGTKFMWDSSNIAFDLYDQLEAFGPGSAGWRPLKIVVRSQAIWLLSAAILDGLFPPEFENMLVRLCGHLGCNEEAAKLASSINGVLPGPRSVRSQFTESRQLRPLCSLLELHQRKRIPGAIFEYLSILVREERLPLAWLSARAFSSVWASSLELLASSKARPSVLEFMCTAIMLLARGDRTKHGIEQCNAEQGLIGIAAGVTSAALALDAEISNGDEGRREKAWRRLIHVLEYTIAHIRRYRHRKSGHDHGLFALAMARYLAVAQSSLTNLSFKQQAAEELEELASRVDASSKKDKHYHQTILLICTIAQCRRRSHLASGHDSLDDICSKLGSLALPDWFGDGLRKDVAFILAQKTKDLRDLAFAESLPAATNTAKIGTMFSGWRWEEGISEWVQPSPESKSKTTRALVPTREQQTVSSEIDENWSKNDECNSIHQRRKSHNQSRIGGIPLVTRTTTMRSKKTAGRSSCSWNVTKHTAALKTPTGRNASSARTLGKQRSRPALAILRQPRTLNDDWDDLM